LTTLQTLHQCKRYDCVNFTRYYWRDFNIDQHYALISHHFVCWNKILDNEILSVDFKILSLNVKKNLISLTRKKTKRLIFNHHLRSRSWFFFKFIFLRTRFHLQFHLQFHLLHIQLRIQLRIQFRIQLSMHLNIHLNMHFSLRKSSLCMLFKIQIDSKKYSSSKSASISHASFSSMKDHDLKIYINWHIQSKSQKLSRTIVR
jgi:hypothetical protein